MGFKATGVACGLKKNGKKDLAVIYSENVAVAAGVFTTNVVKGHSLQLTMENIKNGYAKAIVINSGNANACVGPVGFEYAREMASAAAELLECQPVDVLLGSTGVIGMHMNMQAIHEGLKQAVPQLSETGGHDAVEAIMTTDLVPKEIAIEVEIQGAKVRIGGIAMGSGMIHPNMATMIGVITTDANITKTLLSSVLKDTVKNTFNRVSVDGDTSVCDMVLMLANGEAENEGLVEQDSEYDKFKEAVEYVCTYLSRLIAKDGEGATKLVEVFAEGVSNAEDAFKIVTAVAKSPLVKTAIFGEDANWGRILTAAGYSGADFDPELTDIYIGELMVCKNGTALDFDEVKAKEILSGKEIKITINLNSGSYFDRMWTCDFSYDYVKINGSYRT
jgi:glutamate N-acetyltransferase/amino-acid N-acetyltransferase